MINWCCDHFISKMDGVPLIIDNGSGFIKAGLANRDEPHVVPALIGAKKFKKFFESKYTDPNFKFGEDVKTFSAFVRPKHINTNGKISNYDNFKKLLDKIVYNCTHDIEETPVLITDNFGNDKSSREEIARILFEKYGVPGLFMPHASTLSLYSAKKDTGVIVDIGDSSSKFVPIYEGHTVETNAINAPIGGRNIDELLIRLMANDRFDMNSPAQKLFAIEVKEKYCYVALDFIKEVGKSESFSYEDRLTNETKYLGDERFRCSEVLFDPKLYGETSEYHSVHQNLFDSIRRIDPCFREEMLQNIIVTGGSSKFPGLVERLDKEFGLLLNNSETKYKISMHENPDTSAWLGGVIMAGLPNFLDYFITREQYNDSGPGIVHRHYF